MTRLRQFRGLTMATVLATAVGVGASSAAADTYTDIGPPWPSEDSHQQILDTFYGGEFELLDDGVSFANGDGITAQRVPDNQDQVWDLDLPVNITSVGRFAMYDQSLGYLPGASGPLDEYVNLFDVTGSDYNVTGGAVNVDLTEEEFRWARRGQDGTVSSLNADNPEGDDHMITYEILGTDRLEPIHLLFFEDHFRDFDFQDLVVEVAAVPSPAAIAPGLALLGAMALVRRRRDRE